MSDQMFSNSGGELPLDRMFNRPKEMPGPPFWLYDARVDGVR